VSVVDRFHVAVIVRVVRAEQSTSVSKFALVIVTLFVPSEIVTLIAVLVGSVKSVLTTTLVGGADRSAVRSMVVVTKLPEVEYNVLNVYGLTSTPLVPKIYIFVPSGLKAMPRV